MDVKISKISKLYMHFLLCFVIISANFPSISSFYIKGCKCGDYSSVECEDKDIRAISMHLRPFLPKIAIAHPYFKESNDSLALLQGFSNLHLSHCNITSIPDNIFTYVGQLKDLTLSSNSISSINTKTFVGLSSLTSLDLSNNKIEELDADIFTMLHKLEELDLSMNKIAKIHLMAFNGVVSLNRIDLHSNSIDSLPIEGLKPVAKQINYMNLGGNKFTSIPDNAFEDFKYLTSLQLNRNGGLKISGKAFRGMPNLSYLYLTPSPDQRVPFEEIIEIEKLEVFSIQSTSSKSNFMRCDVRRY